MTPTNAQLVCRVRESIFDETEDANVATLKNIHVSRLFDASPEEFFAQYAAPNLIEAAHLRETLLTKALTYLKAHSDKSLIVSGLFGESVLRDLRQWAEELGIEVLIVRETLTRAVSFQNDENAQRFGGQFTVHNLPIEKALNLSGAPSGTNPATYWEGWFKAFYAETLLAGLKIREESRLFDFLREAARYTGRPVNWTEVGKAASVSQATSRRWCALLERLGIIDLVDPVLKVGRRRIARRKKLFWKAPGLALWLTRTNLSDKKQLKLYALNALYLSLKDAFSDASFSYALDTNGKEVPLLLEQSGEKIGVYCLAEASDKALCERDARSYAKIGLIGFSVSHKLYTEVEN